MKIFSAKQIKDWDNYTIANQHITSTELMERAAKACAQWLINHFPVNPFKIFCGKGNNGGDGLAVARMLIKNQNPVSVYILEGERMGSDDFQNNLARLNTHSTDIHFIRSENDFPQIEVNDIVIDALFGTGLNKPLSGLAELLVKNLNKPPVLIISIDLPSGMFTDNTSLDNTILKADYTLTFQQHKLAFMMAENERYFGKIIVLDINLHPLFYEQHDVQYELTDRKLVKAIYRPRNPFSNKGNFGHACLVAGSYGMMGAAVLAAKACLKSGVGKLTCVVCEKGYEIMQISAPEAMCRIYGNTFIENFKDYQHFQGLGVGPGIAVHESHKELLQGLFKDFPAPMVIDADALNTLSGDAGALSSLPENCIITPHPKEFDRLFGKSANDFERVDTALRKSHEHKIYIVLKGHHTLITTPYKRGYFNSTGNAGMAKGGSGDVLTGILTGFVAQGYPALEACLLGVYLHGMAGDIAAEKYSEEAMNASDIVDCLGLAFKALKKQDL